MALQMDFVRAIVTLAFRLAEGPGCWRVAGDPSGAMQLDAAIGDVLINLRYRNHGYFLRAALLPTVSSRCGFLHQPSGIGPVQCVTG